MEPVHRKIELQAPSELTSLMANASRIARAKIDLHLPPSAAPAGEDALRRRVEELVDAVWKAVTPMCCGVWRADML